MKELLATWCEDLPRVNLGASRAFDVIAQECRCAQQIVLGDGIEDGEVLAGELPRKQLRLVQAWLELHRDELQADWDLAVAGENPYKINPL